MKKKGFTLVELLAVIAILAILVIIALPNVIELFQEARRNSFANEVKELYKQSESQWALDSYDISSSGTSHYYSNKGGNVGGIECKALKMSGRQNIDYMIVRDKDGNVTHVLATDGTYSYKKTLTGTDTNIEITEIANDDVKAASTQALTIKCSATGE